MPDNPELGGPLSANPASSARLPGWVVPAIILALVGGFGIGLPLGMLLADGDSGQEAASTSTSVTPAATGVGLADAYGAAVTVQGESLPMLEDSAEDTAVGLAMPQMSGTDYAGNPLTIAADGRPKLIVALAHWCPFCNAEVPILNDWFAAGVPEGLDVIALSVYADPNKSNFPPATWLTQTEFGLPLIADDQARTLVRTLGIPAVPFWLFVDADGTVVQRHTGQLEAAALDSIAAALAGTLPGATTTVP